MPFARVNGTMLYYRETGEGRLAVFLHGFPLDHTVWLDQLTGLGHVRRCVAVDLRGFGRSEPITDDSLSMEMMADDVAALITALGEDSADIVGVSMGGYVAMALLALRPEMVRSLTLLDTRAKADDAEARASRERLIQQVLERGRVHLAGNLVPSLLGPEASSHVRARLRSMIEGTRYETMVAALEGMRDRPDRTDDLRSVAVPSLVLGGEHDTITPPGEIAGLAEAIPGARSMVVRGAGHLPPMERPDRVNESIIELFEGRKVVWWKDG
ncbi:MAG: alpha/beta fold hydrolase [Acidimicrobiia bacterium]|nr:alpha/beta fold hydrolase [Acidimicrobiia bacterium]